jgi:hypothetical protein
MLGGVKFTTTRTTRTTTTTTTTTSTKRLGSVAGPVIQATGKVGI